MQSITIPFGKYKGQPVEQLQNDPQYTQWLLAQPWFSQRYTNIQTLIVNNFKEPDCTPEHNAMQARFLDRKILFNAILAYENKSEIKRYPFDWVENSLEVEFEYNGWDLGVWAKYTDEGWHGEPEQHQYQIFFEFKPSIGEDFPNVLRQVKSKKGGRKCVVFDNWICESVPLSDVRTMFFSSGVLLISFSDLPNYDPPAWFYK